MHGTLSTAIAASLVLLSAFFQTSNGLRGALVRTGRSLKNVPEGQQEYATGGSALDRALFYALKAHQHEQQLTSPFEGNTFLRFGRSLYDAGAEGSSILRSQRGILQQEQPMIVIDADEGQLMRYGR